MPSIFAVHVQSLRTKNSNLGEHCTQVRNGNVTNLDDLVALHHSPLSLDRVHPETRDIARARTVGTVAKGRSVQGLRARVQSSLQSRALPVLTAPSVLRPNPPDLVSLLSTLEYPANSSRISALCFFQSACIFR